MSTCSLTPLGKILAARRISVFGHTARLESDVPAHMALRRHIDLSIGRPPGPKWRRRPGRPRARWIDHTRFDWTRAVHQWNSGGVPSTVAMLLEQHNGPRRLRDIDDADDDATVTGVAIAYSCARHSI